MENVLTQHITKTPGACRGPGRFRRAGRGTAAGLHRPGVRRHHDRSGRQDPQTPAGDPAEIGGESRCAGRSCSRSALGGGSLYCCLFGQQRLPTAHLPPTSPALTQPRDVAASAVVPTHLLHRERPRPRGFNRHRQWQPQVGRPTRTEVRRRTADWSLALRARRASPRADPYAA